MLSSARIGQFFLQYSKNTYYLATIHRAENTDNHERMEAVIRSLGSLKLPVVLPLHPRTRKIVRERHEVLPANIIFVEPIGYQPMLYLAKNSKIIITDSGGLQKEAYFLDVPCITVRDETEWVETLQDGWNVLSSPDAIASHATRSDITKSTRQLFGNGKAAEKIATLIEENLSRRQ